MNVFLLLRRFNNLIVNILSNFIVYSNSVIILITISLVIDSQGFTLVRLQDLTLEEKIGQLFIIPACELRGEDHLEDLQSLIQQGCVGGILLKQGTIKGQKAFIDKLQQKASLPLLCVQDGEWGVAMRLSDALAFPRNLTLGAVQDHTLLYQLGQEIGRQCRWVGTHLNLIPVADVNCNPQNPIIHMRSFGEDPVEVALRSEQVMRGMHSQGIMACAKHFPGHGDTSIDSHVDLPIIPHGKDRLHRVELYPFQTLIDVGVQAVMTAHLYVPAFAEDSLLPATFSHAIVTDLLQKKLGFDGLVISDALNMRALTKADSPEQIAIKALLAGHDLLLYGDHIAPNIDQILRNDIPRAFAALKAAVENKEIPEALIDDKVRKILHAKGKYGLFEKNPQPSLEDLKEAINSPEAFALKKKLFEEAITVVRNEEILPLKKNQKVALVEWGSSPLFKSRIEKEFSADSLSLDDPELFLKLEEEYSCVILSLAKFISTSRDFGLGLENQSLLRALSESEIPVIAVVFGTPYSLSVLPLFNAIVVAYERDLDAQEAAAKVLLGQLIPRGRLPVSVPPYFQRGAGVSWMDL